MTALLSLLMTMIQAAAPPAALEGTVTWGGSSDPVVHARVLIAPAGSTPVRPTLTSTDEHGHFAVYALPPGPYRLIVDHDGFLRAMTEVIVADAKTATVGLAMTATGVISGRMTDGFGTPVARAFVRATSGQRTFEAQTNDLGEYRIFDLPPGSYVVSGAPYLAPRIQGSMLIRPTPPSPYSPGEGQGMLPLARMVQAGDYIESMALTREVYLPVFYPGTTEQASASPIDVMPGATIVGIDLTIARASAR